MDHNPGVGQSKALALCARTEQQGAHARCHAHADRGHIGLNVLHGVIDGQSRIDYPTWAVYIQVDIFIRILGFQEQKLGNDQVGHMVIDGASQEDDAILEEPGVNVKGPLPTIRLFNNHWD